MHDWIWGWSNILRTCCKFLLKDVSIPDYYWWGANKFVGIIWPTCSSLYNKIFTIRSKTNGTSCRFSDSSIHTVLQVRIFLQWRIPRKRGLGIHLSWITENSNSNKKPNSKKAHSKSKEIEAGLVNLFPDDNGCDSKIISHQWWNFRKLAGRLYILPHDQLPTSDQQAEFSDVGAEDSENNFHEIKSAEVGE